MKKSFVGVYILVTVGVLLSPVNSYAHPGRTDTYGCHTCRTNCSRWGLSSGEYHCHNAKALPQPKEPVTSHYSPTGGYTEPAPKYKAIKPPVIKQMPVPSAIEELMVPKVQVTSTAPGKEVVENIEKQLDQLPVSDNAKKRSVIGLMRGLLGLLRGWFD